MLLTNVDLKEFALYLRYHPKKPKKDITVTRYVNLLQNVVIPFFYERNLSYSEVSLRVFFEYLRVDLNLQRPTRKNYLKMFAHLDAFLKVDYSKNIGIAQPIDKDFDVLTNEEIEMLIRTHIRYKKANQNSVDEDTNNKIKDAALLAFAELGVRPSQLLPAEWQSFKGDYLNLYSPKVKRNRDFKITQRLRKAIEALPKHSSLIFPITDKALREELNKRVKYLGIPKKITLKTFRKTVGTRGVDDNIPLPVILDRLDHKNMNSILPYIQKSMKNQEKYLQMSSLHRNNVSDDDVFEYFRNTLNELNTAHKRKNVPVSFKQESKKLVFTVELHL